MTTNAKEEFLEHTEGNIVKCVSIVSYCRHDNGGKVFNLSIGYTQEDMELFLESLDFSYSSGFGTQELYGTIWYTDGTWSHRGEYDGSEWREHNEVPEIPEELI